MKNIIDIWNENNNTLPIKVARKNWRTNGYAEVVNIEIIPVGKKRKTYEVLAKVYNGAEQIGNNFTYKNNGLYIIKKYDYKNWYVVENSNI